MNQLSLNDKRKLLSIAKRLKVIASKNDEVRKKYHNLIRNSKINIREYAYPTTNATRNIVRRLKQYEQTSNYHNESASKISRGMLRKYGVIPGVTNQKINVLANLLQRSINNNSRRHTAARAPVGNILRVVMSPNRAKRMANQYGQPSMITYLKSLGLN